MSTFKIGHGYDVHRLCEGRNLILGGIKIEHTLGLLGHSDADVLLHAVCDAVLGALGQGDIGKHFPDTDNKYEGISSMILAKECAEIMKSAGYSVGNIDVTVIAQKPKLLPYVPEMKKNLATVFNTAPKNVNIKATTEEGLGFTGGEQAIACHAIVLLERV